ncbi:MAG: hypothetical protein AAFX44_19170 [Pseudomonadota bacterium]
MKQQRGFNPVGNPIVNAVTMVLGAIALIAAIAFASVAFVIFLIAAVVFVSFVALRVWWIGRKMPKRPATKGDIIEVEYEVIERRRDP